jgi:hypothetical protein
MVLGFRRVGNGVGDFGLWVGLRVVVYRGSFVVVILLLIIVLLFGHGRRLGVWHLKI